MGHDIGIAKHYLADNIKQEYTKFEQVIRLALLRENFYNGSQIENHDSMS